LAAGSDAAGAVGLCAKAELASSNEAKAAAATREEIVIMETPQRVGKRHAGSRCEDEPQMNETCRPAHFLTLYLWRLWLRCFVTLRHCARMLGPLARC
jgi:hypothetical protein